MLGVEFKSLLWRFLAVFRDGVPARAADSRGRRLHQHDASPRASWGQSIAPRDWGNACDLKCNAGGTRDHRGNAPRIDFAVF